MSRIILVRHGDIAMDGDRRYWGSKDVELNPRGAKQADRLRDRLAPEKIDFVYSSTLQRARVTASTIVTNRDLPVTGCQEMNEINFGQCEGLTWPEICQRYPGFVKEWEQRLPTLVWPGGEAVAEVFLRVGIFADRLRQHADGETVLVVAHHGTLRSMLCNLMGIEQVHRHQFSMDRASISIMESQPWDANLITLNDKSHLSGL